MFFVELHFPYWGKSEGVEVLRTLHEAGYRADKGFNEFRYGHINSNHILRMLMCRLYDSAGLEPVLFDDCSLLEIAKNYHILRGTSVVLNLCCQRRGQMFDIGGEVAVVVPTVKKKMAQRTVKQLKKQTIPVRIIVVDDPTLNVAEARNRGIKESNSEIIGFTDDDCLPHRDWAEKAVRNFGPAGVAGVEGYTYGGLGRIYPWGYMSCNIFYRRDILDEGGGFDPKLAGWGGDTDLAWRILKKGYRIKYEPDAKVHHLANRDLNRRGGTI